MKAYIGELIGTALLVLIGCGATIFAGRAIGVLGVALAFGFGLTVVVYLIDGVSGAHVNPAVTLTMALSGKFPWSKVLGYIVAQIVGAILGAVILYAVVSNMTNGALIINAGFATNALSEGVGVIAGALIEIIMTMVLCLAILDTTRTNWSKDSIPLAYGIALFATYIVAIPLTGGSLNPARSIGPALVSGQNLDQLGLFILSPILGAVLAYFVHIFVFGRDRRRKTQVEGN
ncbi:Aquaporin Z 2 [bioreactor metagenome]|uniref:Aquaporin Z 2 n=1 Tax=bioreactor metagenome TaxID=1076179 RepID=A0A644T5J1_9ZZZZ|nr:aquaporin [Candidatus Elulimicrobiales bacterium]